MDPPDSEALADKHADARNDIIHEQTDGDYHADTVALAIAALVAALISIAYVGASEHEVPACPW